MLSYSIHRECWLQKELICFTHLIKSFTLLHKHLNFNNKACSYHATECFYLSRAQKCWKFSVNKAQLKCFTHDKNDINGFSVKILFPLLFSSSPLAFQLRMTEISGCSVETPVRTLHCTEKARMLILEGRSACVYRWCNMCFNTQPRVWHLTSNLADIIFFNFQAV